MSTGSLPDAGPRDHVVCFYQDDADLAGKVAGYLRGALRDGGAAIVIATPGHRRLFRERLTAFGVDIDAGSAYLELDAGDTLRQLMAGGSLDPARFDAAVASVIRAAAGAGRPVRAYGEMVALLWDAGLAGAAIELEGMWNDLGRAEAFSLFCGYPLDSVAGPAHSHALAQVCGQHATVLESAAPVQARAFPASPGSVTSARHFVTRTLRQWRAEGPLADAALAVTELAANAVLHARSGFTVTLLATGATVPATSRLSPSAKLAGQPRAVHAATAWVAAPAGKRGSGDRADPAGGTRQAPATTRRRQQC